MVVANSFKSGAVALLNFVYPPTCLCCEVLLSAKNETLCSECLEQLEFLDPQDRCTHCFAPALEPLCRDCYSHRSPIQTAAAFLYEGTAAALVKRLKFGNRTDLAPSLASFLALQVNRLAWDPPDYLVPVPMYWMREMERGYNQSYLIAKELQYLWGGHLYCALTRRGGESCQGGLSIGQRKQLSSSSFTAIESSLQDCSVCIIDDVATTGSTIAACAEALLSAGAASVRALAICRAGL